MRRLLQSMPLTLVALLALGAWARADKAGDGDKDFLMKASTDGDAEVRFAQLAEKQAGSDAVKTFAREMSKEHDAANKQLADAAKGMKLAIVAGLEKSKRDEYERLSKLKGAEFDREYMRLAVDMHEKAVKVFEDESKRTDGNDNLRKFAADTLPKLRDHLKKAREVANTVK